MYTENYKILVREIEENTIKRHAVTCINLKNIVMYPYNLKLNSMPYLLKCYWYFLWKQKKFTHVYGTIKDLE